MMKDSIGYLGGSEVSPLGSKKYVRSFFLSCDEYIIKDDFYGLPDWSLITDGLYRRVILDQQIDRTIGTMMRLLLYLSEIPLTKVDWSKIGLMGPQEGPDKPCDNLGDFFSGFGSKLISCGAGMAYQAKRDDYSQPRTLRLGCTSIPEYLYDEQRPIEEYEALEGDPFWLQEDLPDSNPKIDHKHIVLDGNDTR